LNRTFASFTIAALLVTGCAGTGGISVEDEKQAGAAASRQVEEQVGIYPSPFVTTYVDTIGRRLVAKLGQTPYYFKFKVVDQAEPNAFATPGGYIFVSRGLLALINSEDELAGILAHEISHVTERHHARQAQRGVLPGVLSLPGRAVGAVVGDDIGNIINAPISVAGEAYLSSYGRGQESDADRIGMQLAARAGYDPAGLAHALSNLERTVTLLTGKTRKFGFFDSHPMTPNRIADIEKLSASMQWQSGTPVAATRPAVFKRIDGLTWGPNNPQQGVFDGQRFMQPDMNLSMTFPAGWRTLNTPRYVGAFAPGEDGIMLFGAPDEPGSAAELANAFAEEVSEAAGIEPVPPIATTVGEWPAWVVKLDDSSGTEPVSVYYVWIDAQGAIFQIVAFGPQRYFEPMRDSAQSLRRMTPDELKSIVAQRIRIASAVAGESYETLSVRTGNTMTAELTAAINGKPGAAELNAGEPVKILREEPYFGN